MKRPSSYYTCHRHRPFATEEQAYQHLRERIKAGEVDPGMTTYRCSRCRRWHIGGNGFRSLERAMRGEGT